MAAAAVAPSGTPSAGPPPVACPQCGNFWGTGSLFVRDTCGHRKCRGCVIVEGNECGTCSLRAGGGGPAAERSHGAPVQERGDGAAGASGGSASRENEVAAAGATGGPANVSEAAASGAQPVNKNVENNTTARSNKKSDEAQQSPGKKVLDELKVTNANNVTEDPCEDSADAEAVDDPDQLADSERPTAKRPPPPSHGVIKLPGLPVTYCCTICGHKFKSRSNIRYHYYCGVENKPLTCELCEKGFVSKSHYQYHMRDHAGDLPYKCDVCGKGFKQKTKLKRHTIVHTADRKFECPTCGKRFTEASHLKVHSRLHTGELPYKCEHCGRGFNEKTNYSKHVRSVHTNERPYACEMCGKCFARSENFKVHLRRHEGIRPFECPVCSLTFYYKKDMTRHMPVHDSSFRPFECDKCSQMFKRKDNLLRHIKLSHNENEEEEEESQGEKGADAESAPPRESRAEAEMTLELGTEKNEDTARVEAEKCGGAEGSVAAGPGTAGEAEAANPGSQPDGDKRPAEAPATCGSPSDANCSRPLRKRRVRVPPEPSAASSLPAFRRNVTPPPGALPEPPRVPRHCLPAPRERRAVLRPPVPVDFLEAAAEKKARGRAGGRKRQKREPQADTTDIEKVGFIQVPQYPPKPQPATRPAAARSEEAVPPGGAGSGKAAETCGAVPVIRRPQPSNCVRTITKAPQHAVPTIVSPRSLPPASRPAHTAPPLPPLPACSPRPDQPMLRLLLHDTPCSDAPHPPPPPAPVRSETPPAPPTSAARPAEALGLCDVYECVLRGDLGQLAGGRPNSGVRRPPAAARRGETLPAAREWAALLPHDPCHLARDRPGAKPVPVAGGRLCSAEVRPGTADVRTAAAESEPERLTLTRRHFPTPQSVQQAYPQGGHPAPWPNDAPLPAGPGKQKRTVDDGHPPSANANYNLDEFDTYCSFVRIRATKQTVYCGNKSGTSTFFQEEQRQSTYAEVRRPGKRMSAISDRLSDDDDVEEDDARALNYTLYGSGSGGKNLPDLYAPDGAHPRDGYSGPHYGSHGAETADVSDVVTHLRGYTEEPAVTYASGRSDPSGEVCYFSAAGDTAALAGVRQPHVIVGTGKHSDVPYS